MATTRKGKQVLNVKPPVEAQVCAIVPEGADHVAAVGDNRKLLIFPLAELPEMTRGKGVRLQKYKDGGLSDVARLQPEGRSVLGRFLRPHLDRDGSEGLASASAPRPAACRPRDFPGTTGSLHFKEKYPPLISLPKIC